jgi:hypothetical protein
MKNKELRRFESGEGRGRSRTMCGGFSSRRLEFIHLR